jgi:hypothetical protein
MKNKYPPTMPNDNKPDTVIQQAWWRIRDLYRELKPCRFSLIVALIGWPVFVCVAQGTEILRTVGEGTAIGGTWERFRICFFSWRSCCGRRLAGTPRAFCFTSTFRRNVESPARNLPRRSSRECTIERKRLLRSIERFWHGIVLNIMNAIC